MLFPLLVFVLFGWLRSLIGFDETAAEFGDYLTYPIYYDYTFAQDSSAQRSPLVKPYPYLDIAQLICRMPASKARRRGREQMEEYPASFLAIIPNPASSSIVQHIVTRMKDQWDISQTHWSTHIASSSLTPETCEPFAEIFGLCRPDCRYDELSFTEGSILKYFDSSAELNTYLQSKQYGDSWDAVADQSGRKPIAFALEFNEYDDWNSISYTLRANASVVGTNTEDNVDIFNKEFWTLADESYIPYRISGVTALQLWLNQIITEKVADNNGQTVEYQFGVFPLPTAAFATDSFYALLEGLLPFLLILAFIYPYFVIAGAVVEEKASKIKEGLRMMGASLTTYWTSVYLYFGFKFFVIALCATLISYGMEIHKYSDFGIILLWYTLFLMTLMTSAIMLSAFFDNPKTASMVSTVFLLTLYFVAGGADSTKSESVKTLFCLSGPACFSISSTNFAKYEEGLLGLHWSNIGKTYKYFKFRTGLLMMFMDSVVYALLGLYFDRVIPSKFGQTLPFYFPFLKEFWCPSGSNSNGRRSQRAVQKQQGMKLINSNRLHTEETTNDDTDEVSTGDSEIESLLQCETYEPVHSLTPVTLKIRNLTKEYSTGFRSEPFVAVKGVSLDMYDSEIFCLLGHNGAGKTSLISALNGMLNITSGYALINNLNVATDMNTIRDSLGVCPQHDVLWAKLTVAEHLEFFASLKGVHKDKIAEEVRLMLDGTKMAEKKDKFPTELSGGQKRKLSLAIALIGGSKIVFLDEPTSGMDPHSRRDAWALIKQSSEGRTIILTTHFMDEADVLADRIAIMADGEIQCCGTPLFLKRMYGIGYSFTISIDTEANIHESKHAIGRFVSQHVQKSELISTHGSELIFRLPFDASASFPQMFRDLDENQSTFHIENYGISVTTLEEVFIKVGKGHETKLRPSSSAGDGTEPPGIASFADKIRRRTNSVSFEDQVVLDSDEKVFHVTDVTEEESDVIVNKRPSSTDRQITDSPDVKVRAQGHESDSPNNANANDSTDAEHRPSQIENWDRMLSDIRARSVSNHFWKHVFAVLYKKYHIMKRDRRAMLCQLFLPFVFMLMGFGLADLDLDPEVYPRLPLDMTQFDSINFGDNRIPVNAEAMSSSNAFMANWDAMNPHMSGTLVQISGGSSVAYEYTQHIEGDQFLRTYKNFLLEISTVEPSHYMSLYFPQQSTAGIPAGTASPFDTLLPRVSQTVRMNDHIGIGSNVSAFHGLPISINIAANLALKKIDTNANIYAYVQPLPATQDETQRNSVAYGVLYASFLSFGLAFFPIAIMYNIVQEKASLVKHQQLVSGMSSNAYWIGSFIFDVVCVLPACILSSVLCYAFNATVFVDGDAQFALLLSLFLYGVSIVPFTYVFSWAFKSSVRAQYVSMLSYLFLGYGFGIACFIMDVIPSTRETNKTIKTIARFSPSYLVTANMIYLALRENGLGDVFGSGADAFDWEVTGRGLVYMAILSVVYMLLALVIEYASTIPIVHTLLGFNVDLPKEDTELDSDVTNEQTRIKEMMKQHSDHNGDGNSNATKDPIIINGLRKVYNSHIWSLIKNGGKADPSKCVIAVRDLYYSVPRGQVFGFLGVNGAGKTTSIDMLCGKHMPSSGAAYINQTPISNQLSCRRMIGYCPQFDAIFDLLTSREHLMFYGLIKGLERDAIEKESETLFKSLTLTPYVDKSAGTYSGGNKRKLSVALAMIGSPPIVFLDEPSTGMDPVSRRHMWDFISSTMFGRSVILTTHSMEECEALCHRIGIMVRGQLRCLGTSTHLKAKFGDGYQLDVKIISNLDENEDENEDEDEEADQDEDIGNTNGDDRDAADHNSNQGGRRSNKAELMQRKQKMSEAVQHGKATLSALLQFSFPNLRVQVLEEHEGSIKYRIAKEQRPSSTTIPPQTTADAKDKDNGDDNDNGNINSHEQLNEEERGKDDNEIQIAPKNQNSNNSNGNPNGNELSLADMFEAIEKIKKDSNLNFVYSLSQTTLEQIFLHMAQHNQ